MSDREHRHYHKGLPEAADLPYLDFKRVVDYFGPAAHLHDARNNKDYLARHDDLQQGMYVGRAQGYEMAALQLAHQQMSYAVNSKSNPELRKTVCYVALSAVGGFAMVVGLQKWATSNIDGAVNNAFSSANSVRQLEGTTYKVNVKDLTVAVGDPAKQGAYWDFSESKFTYCTAAPFVETATNLLDRRPVSRTYERNCFYVDKLEPTHPARLGEAFAYFALLQVANPKAQTNLQEVTNLLDGKRRLEALKP